MSEKNIQIVVANELCFGCGTCNEVCPSKAIHMEFGSMGRLLPVVDDSLCTQCGLCSNLCPGIDITGALAEKIEASLLGDTREVLMGRSANEETFNNSQSGGATTETLAFLFDEGKIDAALVVSQERHVAKYHVVTSKQELFGCQTSQYTPVDLISGLPLVRGYEHVAVVGTPCHIEGVFKLMRQFPKKYSNIDYLLGLICAGTQSQLVVDVVKAVGERRIGRISDEEQIKWRQKKYSNYKRADIAIVATDGSVRMLDNNIRHTSKQYLTAPRCKLCFDKMNLFADIVYGDAWGVSGEDTKNGSNVIICRTENGQKLISEMVSKGRLLARPCPMEEIAKGQGIPKKKKTVEKMLFIYQEKGLLLPGWANSDVFSKDVQNVDSLRKTVDEYLINSKRDSSSVVKKIARVIKKQLAIMDFKKFLRKLIKK